MTKSLLQQMPPRFKKPSLWTWLLSIFFLAFFLQGLLVSEISLERMIAGIGNMGRFLSSSFPPNLSRLPIILRAMIETFQMAIVGTVIGVLLSLPVALLISKNTTPHPLISSVLRSIVTLMRTIPDLVWALIFIISVGLGPLAGIFTIVIDTIAFCARFFSERIEEVDRGSLDAMSSTGAGKFGVYASMVIPVCFPSFVATSLFSVEKAVRSAVILGLVGAGGIGIELSTAMSLMKYDEAFTIILIIFMVVVVVEYTSGRIRKRFLL
ncbi:phosphonate ABC transporter, permease protein PhnE [Sporolactobacillus shoreicorticis]|uniref:Phosphonate ABC transporter, permease protein PhnE n=1 Tax=Sporolactobacillus shoreicorticis TaxID=1923877 RepID=A0ABW5RYY9_9BACL|nr:phosphonate ABC transporter, permease protein PhnE [Sporolactobacillus shoreicorticis]MCO7125060.1 phosphonate ABC transporter, permease protein PhnE [Sporolactobacillus shoreicorticis]